MTISAQTAAAKVSRVTVRPSKMRKRCPQYVALHNAIR